MQAQLRASLHRYYEQHNPSQLLPSVLDDVRRMCLFVSNMSYRRRLMYRHGWSRLLRQIIAKYAGKERQLSAKLQKRYGQPLDLAFLGAAGDETGRSAQNARAASAAVVVTKTLRGPISRWAAGGAGRPDS